GNSGVITSILVLINIMDLAIYLVHYYIDHFHCLLCRLLYLHMLILLHIFSIFKIEFISISKKEILFQYLNIVLKDLLNHLRNMNSKTQLSLIFFAKKKAPNGTLVIEWKLLISTLRFFTFNNCNWTTCSKSCRSCFIHSN
ncbi:hypothetical protein SAMN02745154_00422, partial [Mycoplasmopsis verecunda]